MAQTLTREGIVLAAVMIRRGGNRSRLLVLIGGAPHDDQHFHALSTRTAAHLMGVSVRHVHALLEQLVAAGVLERRPGAGSRPDAWRVRGDVRRWAVLWPAKRDPDHVRLMLAEAGHLIDVPEPTTVPVARAPMGERGAGFARAFMGGRELELSRANGSARGGGGLRTPLEVNATPSSSSAADGNPDPPNLRVVRRRSAEHDAYVERLAALIYRMTGRPTVGRGVDRVAALYGRLELARAESALGSLPAGAGWAMVLGALELEAKGAAGPSSGSAAVRYLYLEPGATGWRGGAEHLPSPEAAAERAAELRAGIGWPAGVSELEVVEP